MQVASVRGTVLWAVAALVLVAVHALVNPPQLSLFWTEALNAGHTPLYAVVAVLVLVSTRRTSARWPFRWTGAITLVAACVSELAQIGGPRSAEWQDFARNCAGGGAGLLLAYAWAGRAPKGVGDRDYPVPHRRAREAAIALAVLFLTLSFVRLANVSVAYLGRDRAFPVIWDFGSAWSHDFVKSGGGAQLEIVSAPEAWEGPSHHKVGRLTVLPDESPGLVFREVHPDWRGYDRLVLEVFSELDEPVRLELRVNDERHDEDYHDRFNREILIQPGENRITVSLDDIRRAPRGREMDMGRVRTVVLFSFRPERAFALHVGRGWLERI